MSLFSARVSQGLQACLRTQLAKGCPLRTNREVKSLNLHTLSGGGSRGLQTNASGPNPKHSPCPRSCCRQLRIIIYSGVWLAQRRSSMTRRHQRHQAFMLMVWSSSRLPMRRCASTHAWSWEPITRPGPP